MKNAMPILAMIATALMTCTMLVCCMAMGANASPEQIRSLKAWMLGFAVLGVAGIVGGILLLRSAQPSLAAGVSIAPAIVMAIIAVIALLK